MMKPFDLEAAKRGEPLVTRDGRSAIFVAHLPECNPRCRVIARVGEEAHMFGEDGRTLRDGVIYHDDLFMAPKKIKVWVAILKASSGCEPMYITSHGYTMLGKSFLERTHHESAGWQHVCIEMDA